MANPVDLENLSELRSYLQQKERTELNSSLIAEIHDQNWRAIWDILFDNATCNTIAVVDKYLDLIEFPAYKRRMPTHALEHYRVLTKNKAELPNGKLSALLQICRVFSVVANTWHHRDLLTAVKDYVEQRHPGIAPGIHIDDSQSNERVSSRVKYLLRQLRTLKKSWTKNLSPSFLDLSELSFHASHSIIPSLPELSAHNGGKFVEQIEHLAISMNFRDEHFDKFWNFLTSLPNLRSLGLSQIQWQLSLDLERLGHIYQYCLTKQIDLYLDTGTPVIWQTLSRICPNLIGIKQAILCVNANEDEYEPRDFRHLPMIPELESLSLKVEASTFSSMLNWLTHCPFRKSLKRLIIDSTGMSLDVSKIRELGTLDFPRLRKVELSFSTQLGVHNPELEFWLLNRTLQFLTTNFAKPLSSLRIQMDIELPKLKSILAKLDTSQLRQFQFYEMYYSQDYDHEFPDLPCVEHLEITPHHEVKAAGMRLFQHPGLPRLTTVDYVEVGNRRSIWAFNE